MEIRFKEEIPEKIEKLISGVRSGENLKITGLWSSRLAYIISHLSGNVARNLMIVCRDDYRAGELYEDLSRLLPEEKVFLFPEQDVRPHEEIPVDERKQEQRLKIYHRFQQEEGGLVCAASIASLNKVLPPLGRWRELERRMEVGESYDMGELTSELVNMGYRRLDMVGSRGEFSVRGGILDIFPPGHDLPRRLEFFGEELESIRSFSIDDQRSREQHRELFLHPASELILPEEFAERVEDVVSRLENRREELKDSRPEAAEKIKSRRDRLISQGRENLDSIVLRQYLPFFFDRLDTVFDYLGSGTLYVLEGPSRLKQTFGTEWEKINEEFTDLLAEGEVLPYYIDNFLDQEQMNRELYSRQYIECYDGMEGDSRLPEIDFKGRGVEPYHGRFDMLAERIEELTGQNFRVLLGMSSLDKCRQLKEHLQSYLEVKTAEDPDMSSPAGEVLILQVNLAEGFQLEDLGLAYFCEREIMGEKRREKKKIKDLEDTEQVSTFSELSPGDYVVHENHGIGRYLGLKPLSIQGQQKDYLLIEYADEDKLYVPTEQIHLVQKYIGGEGAEPNLYRLGGNRWQKVKERVKSSVKELAVDLVELYAAREALEGYAFSRDTEWQQEFEEAFPFEETEDQLQAIEDVKKDMESPHPMDRLLCGDVGYGKTEVAIRAAFKAAVDSKQTAVLVPTTILAQQHFNTFKERIDKFPINVAMLSRFRTSSEQRIIKEKLAQGRIDIIIGTHRLLSDDVEFNDLGLLVIDEEQRFGVSHKEKLKDIKKNIDVLTMTATPIPRTLHMALTGVRDMSVIETPPENRYPIRTYVKERDEDLIRDAIRRELAREGQVYYVHNRVEDIDRQAGMIRELVPEARVAVAHGQMAENHLEKLMMDFYNHEYDVLVCTTIIENGLDIANVNSIVINRADKMGLAQLYQLRGRVGRTDRIAYSYLLYDEDEILSEEAEKRLRAIREFTDLGSGFKIAMRDMEIRGAGNLLGPEQSGHIASIGYSLYCKLLDRAVGEIKGEDEDEEIDVEVNLELDSYMPDDYIGSSPQKIDVYKRLMRARSERKVAEIRSELEDRFGNLPDQVENLLDISRIKMRATRLNIDLIEEKDQEFVCYFRDKDGVDGKAVTALAKKHPRKLRISSGRSPRLSVKKSGGSKESISRLIEILNNFLELQKDSRCFRSGKAGDGGG